MSFTRSALRRCGIHVRDEAAAPVGDSDVRSRARLPPKQRKVAHCTKMSKVSVTLSSPFLFPKVHTRTHTHTHARTHSHPHDAQAGDTSDWVCPHVYGGLPTSIIDRELRMLRAGKKFTVGACACACMCMCMLMVIGWRVGVGVG